MDNNEELDLYKKALKREKSARKEAEQILESKALELYEANQALHSLNKDLEKKLTEKLQEYRISELKFEKVVSEANDIIYNIDLSGKFTYVNNAAVKLTGFKEEELIGKHFSDLIVSPSREEIIKFYSKQIQKKDESSYFEYQIRNKKNDKIWLGQNIQLIKRNNQIDGFLAIARDITDKVIADEQLRNSEEKYRKILENMDLGMIEVDSNEKISKVYQSFCHLTGYSKEELIGKQPQEILLTESSVKVMQEQNLLRKEGVASVYEVQIKKKDGDLIWVLISGAPFYGKNEELAGSIGVHLDITDRKLSEAKLKNAKELAEASSKAKEHFLANMSHEIRTPLNAVIGLSQLLAKTHLNSTQTNYVTTIKSSANSLLSLVNNILDFSKIESGEMDLEVGPFNLDELGNSIVKLFSYQAFEKNLTLEFQSNLKPHSFYIGDRLRINQVLINLINNAVKFTEEGGITLSIKESHPGKLTFKVLDTGIGISKSKIQTIFQKFRQEEESTVRKYGGTGLGLSISQSFVKLFGGELLVESNKNEGSTFYFEIELEPAEGGLNTRSFDVSDNFNWSEYHILLAEDNKVNQFVAESFILEWGAKLTICENGLDAYQLLEKQKFDLVLMDIHMPVMNGVDATMEIRNGLNLNIPIIALTANAVKGDREKFIQAGMDDHISKPFDEIQLKATVEKYLKSNRAVQKNLSPISVQLMDLTKLEKMAKGNSEFVTKMLNLFISESIEQLNQLENNSDHDYISSLAHKIKPSVDYIACSSMSEDVRKIENRDFIEDWSILSKFILDWNKLLEEVRIYIRN